jgi:hypothetical protein
MTELPSRKSIVFIRYAQQPHHVGLVSNYTNLSGAPVWVVHDLGDRNKELMQLAEDRTAFIFDEQAMSFRAFPR